MERKNIRKVHTFNTVIFVALVPDVEDRNGDIISEEEIRKTAYDFMENIQEKQVNINHEPDTIITSAIFVESAIATQDLEWEKGTVPKGSRLIGIKFDDETYQKVLDGEFI
ncbi:MAG: XkdF-like putative serine protease domain-containing protein [Candidatus Peribacteria bacterium]|jgi:hypothetical protein|nr:XkdF-like putative serine protease domain-containing protein [Candidatus Peribacteria bacterium]